MKSRKTANYTYQKPMFIDKDQIMNLKILWLLNVCGYNPVPDVKCKHKFL